MTPTSGEDAQQMTKITVFTHEEHEADDDPLPLFPCVRPKRLPVQVQNVPVYASTTRTS